MNTSPRKQAGVSTAEYRIRMKTPDVLKALSCSADTLEQWQKRCPRLFTPVVRQRNGNIYRRDQVDLMADVMDALMAEEEAVTLWEKTLTENRDKKYRRAGDPTRR